MRLGGGGGVSWYFIAYLFTDVTKEVELEKKSTIPVNYRGIGQRKRRTGTIHFDVQPQRSLIANI